jgi:hypothetical protein
VFVAPPVREAEPPPWINDRWAQPTKCQVPVDIDDPAKGVCGNPFTPVGNQQTCGSPACIEKLAVISDRRRSGTYRGKHREEVRARNRGPEPARKQREAYALKKASKPPIWNTCRWWSAVAAGAPITANQYHCPADGGQFQAKRKNTGFCSEECKKAFILDQNRNCANNDYKAHPEKYKARREECAPQRLDWERNDRKAKPEKYWLKSHEQWLRRKADRAGEPPKTIHGKCGHDFEHPGPGRPPTSCPDCRKEFKRDQSRKRHARKKLKG